MKHFPTVGLVILVLAYAQSLPAQIISLYGEVTDSSGSFSGYQVGAPVELTLDFGHPLQEPVIQDWITVHYLPVTLKIGGGDFELPLGALGVVLVSTAYENGMLLSNGWWDFDGQDFTPFAHLDQHITSALDNPTSPTSFPSGLDLTTFENRTGSFSNFRTKSRVDWIIDSYTGSFAATPMMPVPEPATYGLFATAALVGVAFLRRRKNTTGGQKRARRVLL